MNVKILDWKDTTSNQTWPLDFIILPSLAWVEQTDTHSHLPKLLASRSTIFLAYEAEPNRLFHKFVASKSICDVPELRETHQSPNPEALKS